jgi:hypothetical protein
MTLIPRHKPWDLGGGGEEKKSRSKSAGSLCSASPDLFLTVTLFCIKFQIASKKRGGGGGEHFSRLTTNTHWRKEKVFAVGKSDFFSAEFCHFMTGVE